MFITLRQRKRLVFIFQVSFIKYSSISQTRIEREITAFSEITANHVLSINQTL